MVAYSAQDTGRKLLAISLFSGVAGLELGLRRHHVMIVVWCKFSLPSSALSRHVEAVEYVEASPFCQAVLTARMLEGNIGAGKIFDDIVTYVPKSPEALAAEALVAGFPCQAGIPIETLL